MNFSMSRQRALELGLITCECGHPSNNHFDYKGLCARCGSSNCPKYRERGIHGVEIIELPRLHKADVYHPINLKKHIKASLQAIQDNASHDPESSHSTRDALYGWWIDVVDNHYPGRIVVKKLSSLVRSADAIKRGAT